MSHNDTQSDPAAQDDAQYASPEELEVTRDESGEVLGQDEHSDLLGTLRVKPMPYGAIEDKFGDMGNVSNVGPGVLAGVMRERLVKPDLPSDDSEYDEITEGYIRDDALPLVPREVIMAVFAASGVEADVQVDGDGNAQVELDESGNRR